MKILAIRGKNLASLAGTFAIELDRSPLGEAGLFAITGPTGAGKSTLLDALCLALFDTVPRLPGGQGVMVGRAADPEDLRVRSTDVRAILRRGAVDGHAEVEFLGNDGNRYRARWEVRRARNKADGRLRPQEISLIDLGTQQSMGCTKTEVLELIASLLGLSADQFRRSVLLAQGDFAAFLKAEPKQRSDLLERITGTGIYSEISKAAYRRAEDEKRTLGSLAQRLAGVNLLSEEDRAALEQQLIAQQQRHQQVERDKQVAQDAIAWWKRFTELDQREQAALADLELASQAFREAAARRELLLAVQQAQPLRSPLEGFDRAAKDCETARQAREEAELAEQQGRERLAQVQQDQHAMQSLLDRANSALEATQPELQRARVLDQQLLDASGQYEQTIRESAEAARHNEQALARLRELQGRQGQLQRQSDEATAWFARNGHIEDLAKQWQRWNSEWERYLHTTGEKADASQALDILAGQAAESNRRLVHLAEQLDTSQEASAIAKNKLMTLEAGAQVFSLDGLRQERLTLQHRCERLAGLQKLAHEASSTQDRLGKLQDELLAARHRERSAGEEVEEMASKLAIQRALLAEAERALQFALITEKEDVISLRSRLQDGEPCPVCGATEHPWAVDSLPLKRVVESQQQRVTELKRTIDELAAGHGRQESVRDHTRNEILQLGLQIEALAAELEVFRQQWAAHPKDEEMLAEEVLVAGLEERIVSRLTAVDRELANMERIEQQALENHRQIETARQEFDRCRERHDVLQVSLHETQQAMHTVSSEQFVQQTKLENAGQVLRQLREQFAGPLAGFANWQQDLDEDAAGLRNRCERQVRDWRKREEKSEALRDQMQESIPLIKEAEVEARQSGEQATTKAQAAEEQKQKLQVLQQQRDILLQGRPADALEGELKAAIKFAMERLEQARQASDTAGKAHAEAAASLEHWRQALETRRIALAAAEQDLDRALADYGLHVDDLRQRLSYSQSWLEQEGKALEDLDERCRRAQTLWEERRQQKESHQADNPPPRTAEQAEAELQRAQTESTAAHKAWVETDARLRQDTANRAQAVQLQSECEIQRQRWERWDSLRELIGSADGGKFRSYAQSLTLDVLLAHANRHLRDLARRYRLERVPGSDLELQVVDCEMGDEVRSIHSLSGGESFLVSLALALGLASLSSQRTQVESLFIDEGFGSLDPDTLDVALATLDALQAQGRKVGVISHVPAMVERIGVQVRVEARGGGRSVVRVLDASQGWNADR